MSLGRTALAAALWLALCGALAGCANLRSSSGKAGAQDAAKPTTPAAERAVYQFEVIAPKELRALLTNYLDLARFQSAPETDRMHTTRTAMTVALRGARSP